MKMILVKCKEDWVDADYLFTENGEIHSSNYSLDQD